MKRLVIVASLIAALAMPSFAVAVSSLNGAYSTKIGTPKEFKGAWLLTFASGGTYTLKLNGKVVVRGHDLTLGSQIQFQKETGPAACASVGNYSFKRAGKKLTFTRIHDAAKCSGRVYVLEHPFTVS